MNTTKEQTNALYTALCLFTSAIRTPTEGEQRTFLVLELAEREDSVFGGCYIVDPAIPNEVSKDDLFKMTHARHAAMTMPDVIEDIVGNHINGIGHVRKIFDIIGADNIAGLIENCEDADDFAKQFKEQFGDSFEEITPEH